MKTFVIAEAASVHNGSLDRAKKLVSIAKAAGCDAVKFQLFKSKTLYRDNVDDFAGYKNVNQLLEDLELPEYWLKELKGMCDDLDIEFMATPFDEKAIDTLVQLGVKRLKVAAFESSDPRFIDLCVDTELPLICSLGINRDTSIINRIWNRRYNTDLTILHCNSSYPTPPEDANLKTISAYKELNPTLKVGYSDHTTSVLTPALAVMCGASVIEKHFCLSRMDRDPDSTFSLEPEELKEMVDNIRYAEKTLGVAHNKCTKSEEKMLSATRVVITRKDISAKDLVKRETITTARGYFDGAVKAQDYEDILFKSFKRNIKAGEPILYSDLK